MARALRSLCRSKPVRRLGPAAAPAPPPGLRARPGGRAAEEPAPPAGATALQVSEGSWLVYQGTLRVATRQGQEDSEDLLASLEAAYLGLSPPGPSQEVLLARTAESTVGQELAIHEAVTLVPGPDASLSAKLPVEDRATRVSPVLFNSLPLSIFPPLGDFAPRQWVAPAKLQVHIHDPLELAASHHVEKAEPEGTVTYTVEARPGQKLS